MVKESGEEEGAKEEKRWWKEREGGVEEQMEIGKCSQWSEG
jgi:hypothetical protein